MSETHPLDLAALRQLYATAVAAPPDAHTIKERLQGQERLLGAIPALLERLDAAEHAVTDAVITTHLLGHEAMQKRLEQAERERDQAVHNLALLNRMYDRMHDEYAAMKEASDLTERIHKLATAARSLDVEQDHATTEFKRAV